MSKTEAQNSAESYIKHHGIKMAKQRSTGGLFRSPTFDSRIVYSLKDVYRLSKQGFSTETDLGEFVFEALIGGQDE